MKWLYWGSTGLISLMMLGSAGMYLFNTDEVNGVFQSLGFPTFIVIPLAIAKILGVLAITTRRYPAVTEWAYAGFFFDFLLAFGAHLNAGDNELVPSLVAIALLATSYFTADRVRSAG